VDGAAIAGFVLCFGAFLYFGTPKLLVYHFPSVDSGVDHFTPSPEVLANRECSEVAGSGCPKLVILARDGSLGLAVSGEFAAVVQPRAQAAEVVNSDSAQH
jgi:hypothetical protein